MNTIGMGVQNIVRNANANKANQPQIVRALQPGATL